MSWTGLKITARETTSLYCSYGSSYSSDTRYVEIQYSLDDGNTWNNWLRVTAGSYGTSSPLDLNTGDEVCIKNNVDNGLGTEGSALSIYATTGSYDASGDITSLSSTRSNYCFRRLFGYAYGSKCVSAKNLIIPSSSLYDHEFAGLFYKCSTLLEPPSLPATTLAEGCYLEMFYNCTGLTTAPELPATTLAKSCYGTMFSGCTNLSIPPKLPATTLAEGCYVRMFRGCTSLHHCPKLNHVLNYPISCFQYMFYGCTLLTRPASLPTLTIERYGMSSMYENCSNLYISSSYTSPYIFSFFKTYDDDSYILGTSNIFKNAGTNITTLAQNTQYYCKAKSSYSITKNITHGTSSGASSIQDEGTSTITITPDSTYELPQSISVSNCLYTYDNSSGEITISDAIGDIVIDAECIQEISPKTYFGDTEIKKIFFGPTTITKAYFGDKKVFERVIQTYNITYNLSNISKYSGPDNIVEGATETIVFRSSDKYTYMIPSDVTVTGATKVSYTITRDSDAYYEGTLVISNATGPVTITGSGATAVIKTVGVDSNITVGDSSTRLTGTQGPTSVTGWPIYIQNNSSNVITYTPSGGSPVSINPGETSNLGLLASNKDVLITGNSSTSVTWSTFIS